MPARIDPRVLFGAALAASGILLLILLSHLTFFGDEWDPLLYRRGFDLDALLRPHAEHLILGPTLFYKGLQATLGMESLLPYALVSTASFLASVVLLFVYLRRRVGDWLGLAGVLPVLFLGTAWEVLLWPFEISFTASMATGIGALLALERDDEGGDSLACALLVLSLAFSELALSFVLGAAVWMILARRNWSRAYVLVVPLVLYVAWYAGWGHTAQSHVSAHNLLHSPKYVLDGLASTAGSLLGVPNTASIWVGRPLLILLVVAVILRSRSPKPLPRSFWAATAILLSFWFLGALSTMLGRAPNASRYQYVGAFLLLMVLADLAGGIRLQRKVVLASLGIASLAVIANLVVLHHYYERMSDWATGARGALAAFEIGGASADPNFVAGPANTDIASLNSLQVGAYLSAVDAFGSPAYSESELLDAPEDARVAADQLGARAEELRPTAVDDLPPAGGPPPVALDASGKAAATQGSCLTVTGSPSPSPPVALPRPGVTITGSAGSVETLELRRFASSFPLRYELRGNGVLLIRTDRLPRPWLLRLSGPGPRRICGIGRAAG